MTDATSVFSDYAKSVYPYRFNGTIEVVRVMGGTPSDPKVAEGFLRKKLGITGDDLVKEAVANLMVERGITMDEASKEVNNLKYLNGFKRNAQGLYIEGRQLKAAIKEAASVARAVGNLADRWGLTRKGIHGFVAEHIHVVEGPLNLMDGKGEFITEPSGILQSFPKNPMTNQSSIRYEEYVDDGVFDFTVITDHDFKTDDWAALWLTGEQQGIGASRSQGYGRYAVTRWEPAGD